TSPSYSFLAAWAMADSTAPNTTSRSTFFSREMASTSINSSRFMSLLLHPGAPAPLEIDNRRQTGILDLVQRETQDLHRCRLLLLRAPHPRLRGRLVAPGDLPARLRPGQRAAELAAIGGHLARGGRPHRRPQGDIDHLTREAFEILLTSQGTVDPRRGDLEALVVHLFDLERVLQLA